MSSAQRHSDVAEEVPNDLLVDFVRKANERSIKVTGCAVSNHDGLHDGGQALKVCWIGHACDSAVNRLLR